MPPLLDYINVILLDLEDLELREYSEWCPRCGKGELVLLLGGDWKSNAAGA